MNSEELKKSFYNVMDEMENPDGAFLRLDFENHDFKINLKYPRESFISDIKQTISRFDDAQKIEMTSIFGFVIQETEEKTTLRGYPSVANIQEERSFPFFKIYNHVKTFTQENEVEEIEDKEFSKCLNAIITIFPEFLTTIGKSQHKTHSYTVDIHTMKVLQGVMKHEDYSKLSLEDKRALQTAVLMHDITKKEGEIDKSHPASSAKDTSFILNRFDIAEKQKNKICLLIKNHDWLERYNRSLTPACEIAKEVCEGDNFTMLCILAKADLMAVQRGGDFYSKYCQILDEGRHEISEIIEKINSQCVA